MILYYSYLSPQRFKNTNEILHALEQKGISLSLRIYYGRRKKALEILSSVLWGQPPLRAMIFLLFLTINQIIPPHTPIRRPSMKEVPIWEKSNLTLEEAAAYSGIGINKLREISNDERCPFVLWVGSKRLIKRKDFDRYIEQTYSL